MKYSQLLNELNKGGFCDLHHEGLEPYLNSTSWSLLIHLELDDAMLLVQPHLFQGIDTPEEDETVGLIRLYEDHGTIDVDYNYWMPVMLIVDNVVTHFSEDYDLMFAGNGMFETLPFTLKTR